MPDTSTDTWVLELRPVGDGPPMAIRMRHALKRLLRDYGVKCVSVRDPEPSQVPVPDADHAQDDDNDEEERGRAPQQVAKHDRLHPAWPDAGIYPTRRAASKEKSVSESRRTT